MLEPWPVAVPWAAREGAACTGIGAGCPSPAAGSAPFAGAVVVLGAGVGVAMSVEHRNLGMRSTVLVENYFESDAG